MDRRAVVAALGLALTVAVPPAVRGADVGVTGLKLIVLDNLATTGKAKAVFVSKDPGVAKGPAGDPPGLTGEFEVLYADQPGNLGSWPLPAPWLVNNGAVAKFVNKTAPAGSGVKVATVKPGKVAKVVAKNLGDASALDLIGGGEPGAGGVLVVLSVHNAAGGTTRMCSRFSVADGSTVAFKETAGGAGRKLVARNGVPAPCPGVSAETMMLPSGAQPAETPGSPGTDGSAYPALVMQFGGPDVDLNHAVFTRYFYAPLADATPDAILVLVPGFEGGGASFKILAENLVPHARHAGLNVEVWAFDRRGHQLEDREGLKIARDANDPLVALDWYFGTELSLPLHPLLAAGPNRRAVFHDVQAGTAFIANWTPLVFSRDVDAVIEAARAAAKNQNVFLGGHSAGTGFTARYAATDFNLTGAGPADPGYAKVRGLVLLEGGGGSTAGASFSTDSLDRMEDRADGGLFHAVRDNAPRCVDGTPCTVATEAADCAGKGHGTCTPPTQAYSIVPGLLNPRILASAEPGAIQGITDPNTGQVILQVDQGSAGNNAIAKVPQLGILGSVIPPATAEAALGTFIDDDGVVSNFATFVRTSVGAPGPTVGGLLTWLDLDHGPFDPSVLPNNGPAPTTAPGGIWGQEKEVTRIDRVSTTFYSGDSNFTDWYYPASGLSTTQVPGVCTSGTCSKGNVGASCANDGQCGQTVNLDSTALSVGRGRRDIENLTQAPNVDVPVISFGGSNGLTPAPAAYLAFAQSLGTCTAASCSGAPRVVDAALPNPAFPTYGDVAGGFEVHISEGFAHIDIVTAEDDSNNNVIRPLIDFLARNAQ
jgi:pimeloyl-ACP methyl ester carboxylesterase